MGRKITEKDFEEFQHEFGNAFAVAFFILESLLDKDKDNHNLQKLHKTMERMRKQYFKTFSDFRE